MLCFYLVVDLVWLIVYRFGLWDSCFKLLVLFGGFICLLIVWLLVCLLCFSWCQLDLICDIVAWRCLGLLACMLCLSDWVGCLVFLVVCRLLVGWLVVVGWVGVLFCCVVWCCLVFFVVGLIFGVNLYWYFGVCISCNCVADWLSYFIFVVWLWVLFLLLLVSDCLNFVIGLGLLIVWCLFWCWIRFGLLLICFVWLWVELLFGLAYSVLIAFVVCIWLCDCGLFVDLFWCIGLLRLIWWFW